MNRQQCEQLLAAYLLDELDAGTRAELDAALETDAALRDRLADLRLTLKFMHQGLAEEGQPRLSDSRRNALLGAVAQIAPPPAKLKKSWWRRPLPVSLTAVAAILVVAVLLSSVLLPTLGRSRELARQSIERHDEVYGYADQPRVAAPSTDEVAQADYPEQRFYGGTGRDTLSGHTSYGKTGTASNGSPPAEPGSNFVHATGDRSILALENRTDDGKRPAGVTGRFGRDRADTGGNYDATFESWSKKSADELHGKDTYALASEAEKGKAKLYGDYAPDSSRPDNQPAGSVGWRVDSGAAGGAGGGRSFGTGSASGGAGDGLYSREQSKQEAQKQLDAQGQPANAPPAGTPAPGVTIAGKSGTTARPPATFTDASGMPIEGSGVIVLPPGGPAPAKPIDGSGSMTVGGIATPMKPSAPSAGPPAPVAPASPESRTPPAARDGDESRRIADYKSQVRTLRDEQKYEEAVQVLSNILKLDPSDAWAGEWHEQLDRMVWLMKDKDFAKTGLREEVKSLEAVRESSIPWYEELHYPKDWMDITKKRQAIAAGEAAETEADQAVQKRLRTLIIPKVDLTGMPIGEAIQFLRDLSGVNIYVKWQALSAVAIDKTASVNVKLSDVTLEKALQTALDNAGGVNPLGYVVSDGVITVSTKADLANKTLVRVYDIRDLILRVPNFVGPTIDITQTGQNCSVNANANTSGNNGTEENAAGRQELINSLVNTITTTIDRSSWSANSGKAGAVKEMSGQLIVTQTAENHRALAALLKRLREAQEAQMATGSAAPVAPALTKPVASPTTRPAEDARTDESGREKGLPPASTFRETPVNPWVMTERDRFSTFASDVDSASYSLCRAYLRSGYLPPRGAVRMEEFVNAFDYNYPRQAKGVFNIFAQAAPAPFAAAGEDTTLLKIGVQGRVVGREGRKIAHLVFVIDTSGSMATPDRLPLVQESLRMLVAALSPDDRVSLVTYNREASLLLEAVPASKRDEILAACEKLRAGGSTNLLAGLEAGYDLARREFVAGRINRVILCSDGAANIGQTDSDAILEHVAGYRRHGITLTVAGFGRGGYNDELMETLAKRGDGSYLFIDTPAQARQAFVEKMTATLQTIALDAKIQVEFDPTRVRRYRLIGYEKRAIADEDFRNDAVAAAQVGSGQSATALYEVELTGKDREQAAGNLGTVYVRYRDPDGRQVDEISQPIDARIVKPLKVEQDPRFYLAACAARFAEILRESPHAKNAQLGQVEGLLRHVTKALPLDNRASELLSLVQRAKDLPHAP